MNHSSKNDSVVDWRPTPKFIIRRDAIRIIMSRWKPGRFLEMGAGTGTMTRVFLDQGFFGVCQDLSEDTIKILNANLRRYGGQVSTTSNIGLYPDGSFDYLFAFEVLEHIKDDLGSLIAWSAKLRIGGTLMVSVPAHQYKYSKEDEWVGHVRRYEKSQLIDLLNTAGLMDVRIYNYGFPLGNISGWISRNFRLSGNSRDRMTFVDRSIRSGVQRSDVIRRYGFLFSEKTLFPFLILQRFFFKKDFGDGYIATGKKTTRD